MNWKNNFKAKNFKKNTFQSIKMHSVWQPFFFFSFLSFFFFWSRNPLQLTYFYEVFWFQQNCFFQESLHTPKICRFLPSVSHFAKIHISNFTHLLPWAHKTAFAIPQLMPIIPLSTANLFNSYPMKVCGYRVCQRQLQCHSTLCPTNKALQIAHQQFYCLLHNQTARIQVHQTQMTSLLWQHWTSIK